MMPVQQLTLKLIGSRICLCFGTCGCRTLDCLGLAGEGAQLWRKRSVTNWGDGMVSRTRTSSRGVASGGSSCRKPHQHLHPRTAATLRLNPHLAYGESAAP